MAVILPRVGDAQQAKAQRYVPGEVLVKYVATLSEDEKIRITGVPYQYRRMIEDDDERQRRRGMGEDTEGGDLELLRFTDDASVEETIQRLRTDPRVQYAEPNWIVQHNAITEDNTANDARYIDGSLWGMYGAQTTPSNVFGSQAGEAWAADYTGSHSVVVGIIDEGVDFRHPDLAANIWTNPFDPEDGIDNDGNGYVDDIHGWDFFSNNNSVYDGAPGNNTDAHGTHVAGTIGAVGGNDIGVVGVNWRVTMIPCKFLGPEGGSTADAIQAINYLTDLKLRQGLDIVATNNSWGGGGYSQALHDAIIRSAKAGILFVAAAGNQTRNNDTTTNYPSNYDTTAGTSTQSAAPYDAVIAVASLTSSGGRSSFSNYGVRTVDLGAPGSSVLSTTPNGNYAFFSGTSMATPHVTGAVALYASIYPEAIAEDNRLALLEAASATPTSSLQGSTVTDGRLNIAYLLTTIPEQPQVTVVASQPTATEAGALPGTLTVSRTGDTVAALQVDYSVGGTATPDNDFVALPGTVTIPVGVSSATITVTPIDDQEVEQDESVVVTLEAGAAYTLGIPDNATVTVQSDDVTRAEVTLAHTMYNDQK